MKHRLLLFYFLVICSASLSCQIIPIWTFDGSDSGLCSTTDVIMKDSGSFVCGSYQDSVNLGHFKFRSQGLTDIFLLSFSNVGTLKWGKSFGASAKDVAAKLEVDDKFVYFSSLSTQISHRRNKGLDVNELFVRKINFKGCEIWTLKAKVVGNCSFDVLRLNSDSLIIAGGSFEGILHIKDRTYSSGKGSKAFLIECTKSGEIVSCNISEGIGHHRLIDVCFDKYGGQYQLLAVGSQGVLKKLISNDDFVFSRESIILRKVGQIDKNWYVHIDGSNYIEGIGLDCDSSDRVYLGFNFSGNIAVDRFNLTCSNQFSTAFLCVSSHGIVDTILPFSTYFYCRLSDFRLSKKNSILLSGYKYGKFSLENLDLVNTDSELNTFVGEMSQDGELLWNDELSNSFNYARATSISKDESFIISGISSHCAVRSDNLHGKAPHWKGNLFLRNYQICHKQPIHIMSSGSLCNGDTLNLIAPSGFKKYVWNDQEGYSNIHKVSSPQIVNLSVVDGVGCSFSDSIIVSSWPLTNSKIAKRTILSPGDSVIIKIDSSCTFYKWNDGFLDRNRTIYYTDLIDSLQFTVSIKSEGFCINLDTASIVFDKSNDSIPFFDFYPNPVSNNLFWLFNDFTDNPFALDILDAVGTIIRSDEFSGLEKAKRNTLNISDLKPGNYILRLRTKLFTSTYKFIKL